MTSYTRAELWRQRSALGRLAAWSVAEAAPALLSGLAVARAVDAGFLAGRPRTGLIWAGVYLLAVVAGAAGSRGAYGVLGDVVESFRDRLVTRVVTGALHRATGADGAADRGAIARLTHQVELVRDALGGLLTVVRGFAFGIVAAVLGLLGLAPVLAVVIGVPLLAGVLLFLALIPVLATRQRRYVLAGEDLAEAAEAVIRGHRDIVACGAQPWAVAAAGGPVDAQAAAERSVARAAALRGTALAIGGWLPLLCLLLAAPWLVRSQHVGAGALLGALVYVRQGLQPALHLLVQGLAAGGLRYAITLDRILTASEPPGTPRVASGSGATAGAAGATGCGGLRLCLRDVSFRYGATAAPVLERFDLDVADGDHLVIVGASGIGKSTLAGLMAGLLRPYRGKVLIAGVAPQAMPPAERAAARVLIPQEAYVFAGSLAENLSYLAPAATGDDLVRAVHLVGLEQVVTRLGGLSGQVDPAALSAGERQLIALARAWLAPAPLAILDEATSHLDPVAEARAEQAFARRAGALVVIAHRLSSARRGSRILMFDGAQPCLGTHASLLATSAAYRELTGFWDGDRSDPAGALGDVDRLDAVAGAGLGDDAGEVVADGAR
ncbi:ABC transporter ATP-binding protein [Actinoplanes sp. N902-109]|uniref:ATP-binding cassette domain-containing protein n=1 Tax=Actinoplanes sp. (strain N902-109) TaxID=649831 RepID=UPI0003293E3C|nr:ABC transporter ATP-binding protein [Actinoplanes sp. N902-109]AGL17152.1 ABC transporter [Actinoplanes sp. N902-109]